VDDITLMLVVSPKRTEVVQSSQNKEDFSPNDRDYSVSATWKYQKIKTSTLISIIFSSYTSPSPRRGTMTVASFYDYDTIARILSI